MPTDAGSSTLPGDLALLPPSTPAALSRAVNETRDRPSHLTLAIGYDGREDIVGAVREAIRLKAEVGATVGQVAELFEVEQITRGRRRRSGQGHRPRDPHER